MIGITPAAFTFKGMYWRAPPYCLLPTTRFAYCTGTLRVPLHKEHGSGDYGEQYDYLDKENHKTATLRVHQPSGKLPDESLRKTGDDTDKG